MVWCASNSSVFLVGDARLFHVLLVLVDVGVFNVTVPLVLVDVDVLLVLVDIA